MVRMLIVFWALMSTAGLLTELLFRAAGLVPTFRPVTVAPAHFSWNYTTYLNLIFLVVFGVLYWLYRNHDRLGGGDRYARDPVRHAGETAHAPASLEHDGQRYSFCSTAAPTVAAGRREESAYASIGWPCSGRPVQSISPSPLTSAPIRSISRSCPATPGSSSLPSAAAASSAVGGRSAVCGAVASAASSSWSPRRPRPARVVRVGSLAHVPPRPAGALPTMRRIIAAALGGRHPPPAVARRQRRPMVATVRSRCPTTTPSSSAQATTA